MLLPNEALLGKIDSSRCCTHAHQCQQLQQCPCPAATDYSHNRVHGSQPNSLISQSSNDALVGQAVVSIRATPRSQANPKPTALLRSSADAVNSLTDLWLPLLTLAPFWCWQAAPFPKQQLTSNTCIPLVILQNHIYHPPGSLAIPQYTN